MTESDRGQLSMSAAEVYEERFVPALFAQWAVPVLDAAGAGQARTGAAVLDVACGTGVAAREARRRLDDSCRVVGIDINQGMLDVASRLSSGVEWVQGSAESLPFPDETFDAVVSQFGLMFFVDRAAALREMIRVTKTGCRYAVAVWTSLETSPGYASMVSLLSRLFGADVAAGLRAPFCLGDSEELISLFRAAGIGDMTVNTIEGAARFPSIAEWVQTDIKGWVLSESLDDEQLSLLTQEAEREMAQYVDGGREVAFAAPAHIVSGVKA